MFRRKIKGRESLKRERKQMVLLQKGIVFLCFYLRLANGHQMVINCCNRIKKLHNGTDRLPVSSVRSPTTMQSVLKTEKSRAKAKPLTTFEISRLNADYGDILDWRGFLFEIYSRKISKIFIIITVWHSYRW